MVEAGVLGAQLEDAILTADAPRSASITLSVEANQRLGVFGNVITAVEQVRPDYPADVSSALALIKVLVSTDAGTAAAELGEDDAAGIDQHVLGLALSDRLHPWIAEVIWHLGEEVHDLHDHRLVAIETLCQAADLSRPTAPGYLFALARALGAADLAHGGGALVELLTADEGMCELVPALLAAPNSGVVLSEGNWVEAITEASIEGMIDRDTLLDLCLINRPQEPPAHLRWFLELHRSLDPSNADMIARSDAYLRLIDDHRPELVGTVISAIYDRDRRRTLPTDLLVRLTRAVFGRHDATATLAHLQWLRGIAGRNPEESARLILTLADGLSTRDDQVAEQTLDALAAMLDSADIDTVDRVNDQLHTALSQLAGDRGTDAIARLGLTPLSAVAGEPVTVLDSVVDAPVAAPVAALVGSLQPDLDLPASAALEATAARRASSRVLDDAVLDHAVLDHAVLGDAVLGDGAVLDDGKAPLEPARLIEPSVEVQSPAVTPSRPRRHRAPLSVPQQVPARVETLTELGAVIEDYLNTLDPLLGEIVLDGVAALVGVDLDRSRAELAPLTLTLDAAFDAHFSDDPGSWLGENAVIALLARLLLNPDHPVQAHAWRIPGGPAGAITMRAQEVLARVSAGQSQRLLSLPTEVSGSISAEVLIERVRTMAEARVNPWPMDLEQALLRTHAVDLDHSTIGPLTTISSTTARAVERRLRSSVLARPAIRVTPGRRGAEVAASTGMSRDSDGPLTRQVFDLQLLGVHESTDAALLTLMALPHHREVAAAYLLRSLVRQDRTPQPSELRALALLGAAQGRAAAATELCLFYGSAHPDTEARKAAARSLNAVAQTSFDSEACGVTWGRVLLDGSSTSQQVDLRLVATTLTCVDTGSAGGARLVTRIAGSLIEAGPSRPGAPELAALVDAHNTSTAQIVQLQVPLQSRAVESVSVF